MKTIVVPELFEWCIKPDATLSKRPISEQAYMMLAAEMAKRGTCDRLQVGAVFTDVRMERVLCSGYNGNYAGGPNGCDSIEPGNCGCIHAEANALTKSHESLESSICFVTTSPCVQCTKLLINRRVSRVIFLEYYRDPTLSLDLLDRAKVSWSQYVDLVDLDVP